MTAMLFSICPLTLVSKIAFKGLDQDSLENTIKCEEHNLRSIYREFFGAFTLHRLQLKLINALKHLLDLIAKPNITLQELMQQLSKISALYFEIHSELAKAKRHKNAVMDEIQAQELRKQEIMLLSYSNYYEVRQERADHYRQWRDRQRLKAANERHPERDTLARVKALLELLCQMLGLKLIPSQHGFKLAPHSHLQNDPRVKLIERLLNEFNQGQLNSTALEARLNRLRPTLRP